MYERRLALITVDSHDSSNGAIEASNGAIEACHNVRQIDVFLISFFQITGLNIQ